MTVKVYQPASIQTAHRERGKEENNEVGKGRYLIKQQGMVEAATRLGEPTLHRRLEDTRYKGSIVNVQVNNHCLKR